MSGKECWDNEREWRKVIFRKLENIEKEQIKQGKDIERMKVWTWISRTAFGGFIGLLFYKIRGH